MGLWVGLTAFALLMIFPVDPGNGAASHLAAVALLMAVWWVTDAIPLFATALLPLVLFPLLGIMAGRETAPIYFNSTIVLFLGGFMIALTMEKWNLHRRIALGIIHAVGGGPARIVLGFMIAAAFLSMWIANTATTLMMVPIGLAIILQIEDTAGKEASRHFSVGLMLGIAYGCTVGGLTTLVGTPPNLSFVRIFEILFPDAPSIAFGQWLAMALPVGAIMLVTAWLLITRVFHRVPDELAVDQDVVAAERARLGAVTFEERVVLGVFVATALLWVFRVDLQLGFLTLPGWSNLTSHYGTFDARRRYDTFPHEHRSAPFLAETGQTRMGQPPWRDPDRYIRNSPLFHVERVMTPVLIIQGDLDFVEIRQGEEFFTALYRENKKARFVRYWGEAHTIQSPANIRDMWERIFD